MAREGRRNVASIKDVAMLAKVSVPTVSRYLNNRERVSEEKRQSISDAIDKLNYRPNPIARALVKDRTDTVMVLSTSTALYGPSRTIQGIEDAARKAGYSMSVAVLTDDERGGLESFVRSCLDQNPAGVILLNFDAISAAAYKFLPASLPTVLVAGNRQSGVAQISLCEEQGGYEVTRYLLNLGHHTVWHVSIPGGVGSYTRMNGWRRALEEVEAPAVAPIETTWDPDDARKIGRELGDNPSVTAIFAGNDEVAMGLIRGLGDSGRRVPEDISVAGFDDHPLAKIWSPALTTVRQDFNVAGARAFELLKHEIEDVAQGVRRIEKWNQLVQVSGELIIRESTGKSLSS